MQRGEIYWVNYEPILGSEANSTRPSVIISNRSANSIVTNLGAGLLTVVPMTSNTTRVLDFQVFIQAGEFGIERDSKIQCEQIRTISTQRVQGFIGMLSQEKLREVDNALRIQLEL